mgnify:CR=1 FL=1
MEEGLSNFMVTFIVEAAPDSLYGELTRWLLEPKHGVFVGNVNAMVREKLWKKIQNSGNETSAIMIFNSDTEQGYSLEMTGEPKRCVVDIEGIELIKIQ